MTPDPAPRPTNRQTFEAWMSRNWKWVIPVGCLVPVMFVLGIFALVFSVIKASTPYQSAVDSLRVDCGAQEALGAPVAPGRFVWGSVNVSGPSGHADLAIPLKGGRSSGTLYVRATKVAGLWRFDLLELAIEGRPERIDLRAKGREKCR
jgi:hypothetical protein